MKFGLGKKGFKRKRYADIIDTMETRARSLFGSNINTSERTPLGIFIRIIAWSLSLLWQMAEKVYNSAFVDTATGRDLDKVAAYIGIKRRKAKKAKGEVTISGDEGTDIEKGFELSTNNDIAFETIEQAKIDSSGSVTVPIKAVRPGSIGNVSEGAIDTIVNPQTGIDSVTNASKTRKGRDEETDDELRDRYQLSVSKGGASTVDSIRASLLGTDGVRAAVVIENSTLQEQQGMPPKSLNCFVLGGKSDDIAETILETKAAGIQAYGDKTVKVEDSADNVQKIGYTPAKEIPIYIKVSLQTNPKFPEGGAQTVERKLIQYIGGEDSQGNIYSGIGMGEDVIYTQLIKVIYEVPGIDDVSIQSSTDGGTYEEDNTSIGQKEVAQTSPDKVEVTI